MLQFIPSWVNTEPGRVEWCACQMGQKREVFYWRHRRQRHLARVRTLFHNAGIPPRFQGMTLDSYPAGAGKVAAHKLAMEYLEKGTVTLTSQNNKKNSQRGEFNSILFYGKVGVGKTGLVMPIVQAWQDSGRMAVVQEYYEFMAGLQSTYGNGESWYKYMELAQQVELLVLDDLGKEGNGVETSDKREKLFLLLNYRHSHKLPTLMTSNLDPGRLSLYFEERIVSRILEMAAAIHVGGANLRPGQA